jgi:hypothetical protein
MIYTKNKKVEKNKNKNNKETIITLSKLANISIDESNRNKFLTQMIELRKNQINQNKLYLSILSHYKNNSNKNIKNVIENELLNYNTNLKISNECLNNKIKQIKEKYKNNSILLEKSIINQKNLLETIKEAKFILENKLKEKDSLIIRIKELLCDSILNLDTIEIINGINEDYFGTSKENEKIIENTLELDKNYYNEYLLYKSMKFNKIKNKILKLSEKKNELRQYENKNMKNNIDNDFASFNNDYTKYSKNNLNNNDNLNSGNDLIIPTNVTTENSIFNMNDSLIFDTDEQIDVEFPDNDFSSFFLSQKSLGHIAIKKNIIVPPLDLKLIKYNLKNKEFSIGEKSLSRDLESDITNNIKKLKEKIKLYNILNKNLDKKCEKYERKIKQIACYLYSNKNNIAKNNIINNEYISK